MIFVLYETINTTVLNKNKIKKALLKIKYIFINFYFMNNFL